MGDNGNGNGNGNPEEQPREFIEYIPEEDLEMLKRAFASGMSEEDFLKDVFVGDCPQCNSIRVSSGDELEDVDDPTIGVCEDCGFIWCLECGMPLEKGEECGHWEVCDACSESKDEYGYCGIEAWECPHVLEWLTKQGVPLGLHVCAWCGETIDDDVEMFAVGAKMKDGVELAPCEDFNGTVLPVMVAGKTIPAIVTATDSEARQDGNDLVFMVCSIECATELKESLEKEREIMDKINLN